MTRYSRHAAPVLVRTGQDAVRLKQIHMGELDEYKGRREAFLQNLVYQNPDIIPMQEIEPAFMGMVPVCKELPTAAGFIDNLWLTPTGGIILGECKLAQNSEVRRKVLAQALDYARAVSGMHFDDLQKAAREARKAGKLPDKTLWGLVEGAADQQLREAGQAQFEDAVERRLRQGRFAVLIIIDGVQEGLEALKSYLELHAGLRTVIALVELSVWQGQGDDLLIVPRIPMRTELVERGVVTIDGAGTVKIAPPVDVVTGRTVTAPKPYGLSEVEYYEQLDRNEPGVSARLKDFLQSLSEAGIEPEFRRSVILRWQPSADDQASAGYITTTGVAHLGDAYYSAKRLGSAEAGRTYLERIASLIGGKVRWLKDGESAFGVDGPDGRLAQVSDLLDHAEEWRSAIEELVKAFDPPR